MRRSRCRGCIETAHRSAASLGDGARPARVRAGGAAGLLRLDTAIATRLARALVLALLARLAASDRTGTCFAHAIERAGTAVGDGAGVRWLSSVDVVEAGTSVVAPRVGARVRPGARREPFEPQRARREAAGRGDRRRSEREEARPTERKGSEVYPRSITGSDTRPGTRPAG